MTDFLKYVFDEVAVGRLDKTDALDMLSQLEQLQDGCPAFIHPLVHRNTSNFAEQRFSATFTGHEYFLRDHVVRGARLMPAVAYLEMARAACAAAWQLEERCADVRLESVVWLHPLEIDGPREVHIALAPQADDAVAFEVYTLANESGEACVHVQGRAVLGPMPPARTIDLAALRNLGTMREFPGEACYRALGERALAYGPTFQGLRRVHVGQGGAGEQLLLAELALPPSVADETRYALHPSLMDAALHGTVGVALAGDDDGTDARVPFALDRLEMFSRVPANAFAVIRCAEGGVPTGVQQLDIDIVDVDGQVCARLEKLSLRSTVPSKSEPATALFVPSWRTEDLPPAECLRASGHWIVWCGDGASERVLQAVVERDSSLRAVSLQAPSDADRYAKQASQLLAYVSAALAEAAGARVLLQLIVPAGSAGERWRGLGALLKSAARENPAFRGQVLAFDTELGAEALCERLRREAQSLAEDVRYEGGKREVRYLREVSWPHDVCQRAWKDKGVYLITGGLGGLGRRLARAIARDARESTLLLVGRSSLNDAGRAALDEIRGLGAATVEYHSLDLSSAEATRALIECAVAAHGKLHGIFHGAGVLKDSLIGSKTAADIEAVCAPKVKGLINLDAASADVDLDHFVLFSSLTAVFGNVGQTDYAAANGFMDAYAAHRNALAREGRRRGTTVSINWPLWEEGGMQVDGATRERIRQESGMLPLGTDVGLTALHGALAIGADQVCVIHGDIGRVRRLVTNRAQAAPATQPVALGTQSEELRHEARRYLTSCMARHFKLPADQIDADAPLERYGINSLMAVELTNALEQTFGPLSKTLFFEYQTISAVAEHLLRAHGDVFARLLGGARDTRPIESTALAPRERTIRRDANRRFAASPRRAGNADPLDIAVIGIGGRYPKANTLAEFWANLADGIDCIDEIPSDRWDHQTYYDPAKGKPGKSYSKWGGFIDGVDRFDPLFFNISPREAELLDPQERLFLQCVYETLEDAGYTRESLAIRRDASRDNRNVGVFVGVMYEEYQLYGAQIQALAGKGDPRGIALPGSPASIANRISYFFDLHGPSMAVDTMCSSSLTAIHLACHSLLHGGCHAAIAGGVNVSIHPNKYLALSQGQFASTDGRCASFGEGGDGYVPGEGVGAVLLKPLAQAVEDGDQIYAVIKGSSLNHGGKTNGYTVPNPHAQANVIADALKTAGVPPRAISYLEAHGTGTALGDPIEIAGLCKAFGAETQDTQFCAIGSAKSNIGHLESAAGIAALTKVILQMQHRTLVPSIHSETLNRGIEFAKTPFVVQRTLTPWERPTLEVKGGLREYSRIAGISSFGAGGSNAHLIVEEYIAPASPAAPFVSSVILPLSAASEAQLREQSQRLLGVLDAHAQGDAGLANIAYTLQVGREAMDERLAIVARSVADAREKLRAYLAEDEIALDVYRDSVKRHKNGVASLNADQDAAVLAITWIEKGKLSKLAEFWTRGLAFDWERLYGAAKPRRVSLPTYPFATERYWVDTALLASKGTTVASDSRLHPLLHANTSVLGEQRFTTTFTGEEFFLRDHVIGGNALLPAVAYLEMARAAAVRAMGASAAEPRVGVEITNVAWLAPAPVAEALTLHVSVFPLEERHIGFEIYSASGDRLEDALLHAEGAVRLLEPSESHGASLDIAALRGRADRRVARERCYELFTSMGLRYGDTFRVLTELRVGEDESSTPFVLARISATPTEASESYVLHPSILDGALQACIGMLPHGGDTAARAQVPFALERVEIVDRTPSSGYAYVRAGGGNAAVSKFDLDLCDETGKVCVRMSGFSARPFESATPPASHTLLFSREWQPAPLPERSDTSGRNAVRLVMIDSRLEAHREAISTEEGVDAVLFPASAGDIEERVVLYGRTLLARFQAVLAAAPSTRVLVQIVLACDEAAPERDELLLALSGFLRSARRENPRLLGQTILVPKEISSAALLSCLDGNAQAPEDDEIRYVEGTRFVPGLNEIADGQADRTHPQILWKPAGVYLMTGGAGGLGRLLIEEITASARGARLIVSGRSARSDAATAALQALARNDGVVEYRSLDVTDEAAVKACVEDIVRRHGRLDGVIHSAGVLRDSLIPNKTEGDLHAVLAPKIMGTRHLDAATAHCALDFMLLFSSTASVLGNAGQCDYGLANAYLDRFAAYRNRLVAAGKRGGRALSINWPLWADGGMQVDAATKARLAHLGLHPLSRAEGFAALDRAWRAQTPQVIVLAGDPDRIRALLAGSPTSNSDAAPARTQEPMPTVIGKESLRARIVQHLKTLVAQSLKLSAGRIDSDVALERYGIDSVLALRVTDALERDVGSLPRTLLFEHQRLDDLADYLLEQHFDALAERFAPAAPSSASAAEPAATTSAVPELTLRRSTRRPRAVAPIPQAPRQTRRAQASDIAIVAIGGRYPGADDLQELWANLKDGKDCISEVPAERWDHRAHFDADRGKRGKTYCKWGGFIDRVDEFDAAFFGLARREAEAIDPQTRLFLETTWTLLESGGYTRERLQRRYGGRVGVYVGVMYQHYGQAATSSEVPIGTYGEIANRVSYFFGLQGPSVAVDTMCSSATMAIHLACRDLQHGDCELAIAGGVNLSLIAKKYVDLSGAQLLASTPDARSFGRGDGYLPAEGVGAVLLKPLERALEDGDEILAVIKATAANHAGRSNGFATPNPVAQSQLIEAALRRAQVDPRTVSYVEAAATGSAFSDALEISALTSAFGKFTRDAQFCGIGSVKSNIGHAEAASGMSQLSKVVLQLQHRQLVPSVVREPLNPEIVFERTPFRLQRVAATWERPTIVVEGKEQTAPRRALINSFGAGGSCVTLLVEEAPAREERPATRPTAPAPHVFVVSAPGAERLTALVKQLYIYIESQGSGALADIAYTLQVHREAMAHRLAIVASDARSLVEAMQSRLGAEEGAEASPGAIVYRGVVDQGDSLAELSAGETGEAILNTLIAARDVAKLALLWVNGGRVPWERLYEGHEPRALRLPTYPFRRERYWGVHREVIAVVEPRSQRAIERKSISAAVRGALANTVGAQETSLRPEQRLGALGLDSVRAVALRHDLERALNRQLSLDWLRADQTIEALERQLESSAHDADEARNGASSAPPHGIGDALMPQIIPAADAWYQPFALTEMQEAFFTGRRLRIGGDWVGSHIYFECETAGLDVARLDDAWRRLIAHHDRLRTLISPDGTQRVLEQAPAYAIDLVDWRSLTESARRESLDRLRREMSHRVYDPTRWPLFDIRVARIDASHHRIHFSIDELLLDATGLDLLIEQWRLLYAQPSAALPSPGVAFRDYVLASKVFEQSTRYRKDLEWWVERLRTMPSGPALPAASGPSTRESFLRTRLRATLPSAAWGELRAKADAFDVSPTVLLLTLFAEVLRAHSTNDAFALILTLGNRPPLHPELDRLLGPFLSSTIFVGDARATELTERLRANQRWVWESIDRATVSGVRVLRELKAREHISPAAVLPVVFTSLLDRPSSASHCGESESESAIFANVDFAVTQTPQVYLDHQLREQAGELHFTWDVAKELFAAGVVERMFDDYRRVLLYFASSDARWTLEALAAVLQSASKPAEMPHGLMRISSRESYEPFPLTDQQQAYAFGRSSYLSGGNESCQFYQEIEAAELDTDRLECAWNRLIAHHPMLRTQIETGAQRLLREPPRYAIAVNDWRQMSPRSVERSLEELRRRLVNQVIPLERWPYFELQVCLLPGGRGRVHLCLDMLVADGRSIHLLLTQLLRLYDDPEMQMPVPGISYREYVLSLERYRETAGYRDSLAYWERKFSRLPGGPMLPRASRDDRNTGPRRRFEGRVSEWRSIEKHAEQLGVAPGLVLFAAYAEVLAAWSGYRPFAVVVPAWRRLPLHPDIDDLVGDFTAMSWIPFADRSLPFEAKLRAYQRVLEEDLSHRAVSGLAALRKVALKDRERRLSFPVVFTDPLLSTQADATSGALALGAAISKTPQVNLDNVSHAAGNELRVCWDAATIHSERMIQAMFDAYRAVLERLAADGGAWKRPDFDDVFELHRRQSAEPAHGDERQPSSGAAEWRTTLHRLVEAQVERTPEAIALRFQAEAITFRDLNARANRCARHLRGRGVTADSIVAVAMERSSEMVVALLAILKAGGAYLPLDPSFPAQRLQFMLQDAGVSVVLTQRRFAQTLAGFGGERLILDDSESLAAQADGDLSAVAGPDDLAYVIYTSGSTGQPKGCMISHAAICNRLLWMQREYGLTAQDRVLQKTPYTFDVSVWELFWPLICGATLVVAKPLGHKDNGYLCRTVNEESITVCHFVPSMLRFFLNHPQAAACRTLRHVFTSGEALPFDCMKDFRSKLSAELHNLYGPTEAAVDVTYWKCEEREDRKVPIGRPIDNVRIHILNGDMQPCAAGEEGELYIAGVGVARGYLNRPELTAERFVPDPFGAPGSKMYRTGDRAKYLDDGVIDFLGRIDFQVKVRGLRIELGEIEAALLAHGCIRDAVVTMKDQTTADPKLVAYVVWRDAPLSAQTLRADLGRVLPDYMVPNAFVALERLPVTVHGKLDRTALPWPAPREALLPAEHAAAPQSLADVEATVLAYAEDALRRPGLRADENLLDVGATSLTLVMLVEKILARYGVAVPVDVFLDHPTVGKLVEYVARHAAGRTGDRDAAAPCDRRARDVAATVAGPAIFLESARFAAAAYRNGAHIGAFSSRPVSVAALAAALGVLAKASVDGQPKFLYPSAGDLNAVQTYVYAKSGRVDGIEGGTYYYHPEQHALYPLRPGERIEPSAFLARDGERFESCAFAIFFVGALDAIAPIYGEVGRELLTVEAGYMAQALLARQSQLGIGLAPALAFDTGRLRGMFDLQSDNAFLHCLLGGAGGETQRAGASDDTATPLRSLDQEIAARGASWRENVTGAGAATETLSQEAIERLHDEKRHLRRLPEAGRIALPGPSIPPTEYRVRSCRREYMETTLALEQLGRFLSLLRPAAHGTHGHLFPDLAHTRAVSVFLHVKAGMVDTLDAGLYRYDSDRHALQRIDDLPAQTLAACYTPFNRKHFQRAAFAMYFVAPPAVAQSGRKAPASPALLQAGYIGQLLMERQAEFDIGLCPIGGMRFERVRRHFAVEADAQMVHSFVGGRYVQSPPPGRERLEEPRTPAEAGTARVRRETATAALAIVGISGRYPGARTLDAFWENLREGRPQFATLPDARRALFDAAGVDAGAMASARGGYLEDIECFDGQFFQISPAEARVMDPQERLLLEVAWECLENGGYTAEWLRQRHRKVGVFVGAMWTDYHDYGVKDWSAGADIEAFSNHSALANRLSYCFNFDGPSIAVNTSCSSAVTALHFACESVRHGTCDAALVGGVNVLAHPFHQGLLAHIDLLSPDNTCRPYGNAANGWLFGEGAGVLLIKRLEDAQRDGDHIHAVIRATALGHGGKAVRFGAPNAKAQAQSMREALAAAGVSPDAIGYIETAAPGASIADAAEVAAIREVFGSRDVARPACWIGTLKANIGHLESASAMSQLAKVVLQLRHGTLAPTLGCRPLNPMIRFGDGVELVEQASEWLRDGGERRRALINVFGATGSGGHVILEEYASTNVSSAGEARTVIVPLSAATEEQLREQVRRLRVALEASAQSWRAADIAYTLAVGRRAMRERLAIVADSVPQLRDALAAYESGASPSSVYRGTEIASGDAATPATRDPNAVAAYWVRGGSVAWDTLMEGDERHVPLPTYPFAKVPHWVKRAAGAAATALPHAAASTAHGLTSIEEELLEDFAAVSEIPRPQLDAIATLDSYGINSFMIAAMNERLARRFGSLPKTLFFECATLRAVADYLVTHHANTCVSDSRPVASQSRIARAPAATAPSSRVETDARDIAIVGLSGRYPQAPNVDAFWELLREGRDAITEIPRSRWNHDRYFDPQQGLAGRSYSKWGGFIEDVDKFDPLFFGISPREAEMMDPQERLFLETAYHVFEDAGYSREAIRRVLRSNVGVFVGLMYVEYQLLEGYSSYGSIANRVSYCFDLRGPSMAVDTMCSSSLTAIHLAVESLRRGECEAALAGGVNLSLHPAKYLMHSQMTMSSSDGRCRSFGAGGDGFVPGEGVGAVLLKPLALARRDGDRIYGVIKGSAVNHGGKTNGYTVPSPRAQGELIAAALRAANVHARDISYLEAHGTGTALGDPIELEGISRAFRAQTSDIGYCAIGSVKSNVGHLEGAAGMAGLTKVLLQMRYGKLAPSLHSESINPNIDFASTPFRLQRSLAEWARPRRPEHGADRERARIAGISSFGAGGANAHLIVEEYRIEAPIDAPNDARTVLFVLSAKSTEQVRQLARDLERMLGAEYDDSDLPNIAYTLQVGRDVMEHRVAFEAATRDEARAKLRAYDRSSGQAEGLYAGEAARGGAASTAIGDDRALSEAIGRWFAESAWEKIAALWTQGVQVDWLSLYAAADASRSFRRVKLPTYPFLRERYWVEPGDVRMEGAAGEMLHPLLHRNTSMLGRQRFTSTFTGRELFLDHHRTSGRKVLPGVCYLEMMRAALAAASEASSGFALRNVVWLRPIAVDGQPVTVHVELSRGVQGAIDCIVYSEADGVRVVHAEARGEPRGDADGFAFIDLAGIRTRLAPGISTEALYAGYRHQGIEYGEAHRGIEHIESGHDAGGSRVAVARLRWPAPVVAGRSAYALHPSVLDSALQALAGLTAGTAPHASTGPSLPYALDSVVVSDRLPDTPWVVVRDAAASTPRVPKFDIVICGADGRISVELLGFSVRASNRENASPSTAVPQGSKQEALLLAPRWEVERPSLETAAAHPSARAIVLADGDVHGEELLSLCPGAQRVTMTRDGSLQALIEQLGAIDTLEEVIWLPSTPRQSGIASTDDRQVALGGFRLMKALLALGYGEKPLRLSVFTADAAAIGAAHAVQPAHAALHGLFGSAAKEFPQWQVRVVDSANDTHWPWAALLALPPDARGDAWAYRDGEWYRQRLLSCEPPPASQRSAFRPGGVYLVIGGAGGIGEAFSEYLIRQYRAHVIWIGRRARDAAIERKIARLAQLGPAPEYLQADAADAEALQSACRAVQAKHAALHGVVHAALVLQDRSLRQMDEQRFERTLAAKADVCASIAQVFADAALDFVLFFSSLQSFSKSPGQSNYAAGCTYQDAFAHRLGCARKCAVKIVNWGYWGSVGSVATDVYRARMAEQGIGSIEAPEAMAVLERLLAGPLDQVAFVKTTSASVFKEILAGPRLALVPRSAPSMMTALRGALLGGDSQVDTKKQVVGSEECSPQASTSFRPSIPFSEDCSGHSCNRSVCLENRACSARGSASVTACAGST